MSKHFIIYRTTNRLNGRYYIGMHVTENVEDGYLGSGRRLKAEVKKYGRENFYRVVLEQLPSKEDLVRREAELVTEELRLDPLCLNLKNGGEGGWDHIGFKARSLGGKSKTKNMTDGQNTAYYKKFAKTGGTVSGKINGPKTIGQARESLVYHCHGKAFEDIC